MKHGKKLAGFLLAMVMVLSLAATVFAVERSTLTINTKLNHKYTYYQLLKGDVANLNNGAGTLSNIERGTSLRSDKTVEEFLAAIDGKTNEDLGDTAFEYLAPMASGTAVNGTGNAETVEVDCGYYIITDTYTGPEVTDGSDAVSRYLVSVVGPTIVTPKTVTTSIDKKIIDTDKNAPVDGDKGKTDTAAIGDTIEYEVTGVVPNTKGYTYYYYVVNDTLSAGLTLDKNSFKVKIGTKDLVLDTDYFIYYSDNDQSFQLAIADLKGLVDTENNGVNVNDAISIKYNAEVNDSALIGTRPNTNTAWLQYSNSPGHSTRNDVPDKPGTPGTGTVTGKGPNLITKTYVTELAILKVDENGKKLTGAQFTLEGTNLTKVIVDTGTSFRPADTVNGEVANYYELVDGTFTKAAPSDAQPGETGYNKDKYKTDDPTHVRVTTVTTSSDATGSPKAVTGEVNDQGYIVFTGLDKGTYTLKEIKSPDGYSKMEPLTFTINVTTTDNGLNMEGNNITWNCSEPKISLDSANGVFDSTIENVPGTHLPTTGGIGTTIFYVAGLILLIGAAVLLVAKKRMGAKR